MGLIQVDEQGGYSKKYGDSDGIDDPDKSDLDVSLAGHHGDFTG